MTNTKILIDLADVKIPAWKGNRYNNDYQDVKLDERITTNSRLIERIKIYEVSGARYFYDGLRSYLAFKRLRSSEKMKYKVIVERGIHSHDDAALQYLREAYSQDHSKDLCYFDKCRALFYANREYERLVESRGKVIKAGRLKKGAEREDAFGEYASKKISIAKYTPNYIRNLISCYEKLIDLENSQHFNLLRFFHSTQLLALASKNKFTTNTVRLKFLEDVARIYESELHNCKEKKGFISKEDQIKIENEIWKKISKKLSRKKKDETDISDDEIESDPDDLRKYISTTPDGNHRIIDGWLIDKFIDLQIAIDRVVTRVSDSLSYHARINDREEDIRDKDGKPITLKQKVQGVQNPAPEIIGRGDALRMEDDMRFAIETCLEDLNKQVAGLFGSKGSLVKIKNLKA